MPLKRMSELSQIVSELSSDVISINKLYSAELMSTSLRDGTCWNSLHFATLVSLGMLGSYQLGLRNASASRSRSQKAIALGSLTSVTMIGPGWEGTGLLYGFSREAWNILCIASSGGRLMWYAMVEIFTVTLLDFVNPWHILAYNFQTVHIFIIWKVQEKSIKLRYITSWTGVSTES